MGKLFWRGREIVFTNSLVADKGFEPKTFLLIEPSNLKWYPIQLRKTI